MDSQFELTTGAYQTVARGHLTGVATASIVQRRNFWIATEQALYRRMAHHEDLALPLSDDSRKVRVVNPIAHSICGMVLKSAPCFASASHWQHGLVHVD